MKRVGIATVILTMAVLFMIGCEEDATGVDETGFEVRFVALELREIERIVGQSIEIDTITLEQPALTFAVWVFVDDEYQGRASTDEPRFFSFPSGTYDMYVRSNMRKVTQDTFYSWKRRFTIDENATAFLTYYTDTIFTGL
ncbi:MAG TPA: hypothetical protein VMX58_09470 [Patescibacteria group bacterium]|nr:hypothetical protein [Patescibacteria group bacterium]